jgi:ABC-2 type transport system ATP-binding protein
VDKLVGRLELDPSRPFHALSKGNRQKVGLVQACQHEPDVLLLDEPTSGLDPLVQRELLDLVGQAARRGAAVLFSSHVLPEGGQRGDDLEDLFVALYDRQEVR